MTRILTDFYFDFIRVNPPNPCHPTDAVRVQKNDCAIFTAIRKNFFHFLAEKFVHAVIVVGLQKSAAEQILAQAPRLFR